MKSSFCTILALFANSITAHYLFSKLILNNQLTPDFTHVRDVTSNGGQPPLFGKSFPIYNVSNPDQVCGRSSFPIRNQDISTATIHAGQELGFHVSGPWSEGDTEPYIFHDGPAQVFLSKLPEHLSSLNDYDGSGDWFKIHYWGVKDSKTWAPYGATSINFTIPATTPPGLYLVRVEHLFPSSQKGQSQHFVNCAHLEIVGQGGGKPGPFVRFPDGYDEKDPSIWFHVEGTVNGNVKDLLTYIEPKPALWQG